MLKKLKPWLKDSAIIDIVVYGSTVKGKMIPKDLDILVIFRRGKLKERLEKVQQIKRNLSGNVDIKAIIWEELFAEGFFARSGIFLEGISAATGKPFSEKIDFSGYALFVYSLKDKTHTQKVKFNYVLRGRNHEGIIQQLKGHHLAPGVVQIPMSHSLEFEDVLKMHGVKYTIKNILVQR